MHRKTENKLSNHHHSFHLCERSQRNANQRSVNKKSIFMKKKKTEDIVFIFKVKLWCIFGAVRFSCGKITFLAVFATSKRGRFVVGVLFFIIFALSTGALGSVALYSAGCLVVYRHTSQGENGGRFSLHPSTHSCRINITAYLREISSFF